MTDHDLADYDPDRTGQYSTDQDPFDPDSSSGRGDSGYFRIYAQAAVDQIRRYAA